MHYFTSDTHFGQDRTRILSRRPYSTVEEMDNDFIKKWNETINKDDIVNHLGDFGNYELVQHLNGKICLLVGNYERNDIDLLNLSKHDFKQKLLDYGFSDVRFEDWLSHFNKYPFYLMHEPEHYKYIGQGNNDPPIFALFGHIHQLQMVRRYGLNVGIDCHNYKPISIDTVLFYKNAIENHYDYNVFE